MQQIPLLRSEDNRPGRQLFPHASPFTLIHYLFLPAKENRHERKRERTLCKKTRKSPAVALYQIKGNKCRRKSARTQARTHALQKDKKKPRGNTLAVLSRGLATVFLQISRSQRASAVFFGRLYYYREGLPQYFCK